MENRFSTITEVRNVLWPAYETPEYDAATFPAGHRRHAGAVPPLDARLPGSSPSAATGHPVAVFQRIDQAGYHLPIDERILDDMRHPDGVRPRPSASGPGGRRRRGDRGDPRSGCSARAPACCWRRTTTSAFTDDYAQRQMEYLHHGDPLVPAPAAIQPVHPLADAGARRAGAQQLGTAPGGRSRAPRDIAPLTALPRSGRPRAARRRHDLQLPSAPAALRSDRPESDCAARAGPPAGRHGPAASVHRRRATPSSTRCSGCRRTASAPATSCWWTRPTSPRCSAAPTAWRTSGATSRPCADCSACLVGATLWRGSCSTDAPRWALVWLTLVKQLLAVYPASLHLDTLPPAA